MPEAAAGNYVGTNQLTKLLRDGPLSLAGGGGGPPTLDVDGDLDRQTDRQTPKLVGYVSDHLSVD